MHRFTSSRRWKLPRGFRSMKGNDGDCDSMILISLCYGKQTAVTEARGKKDSASEGAKALLFFLRLAILYFACFGWFSSSTADAAYPFLLGGMDSSAYVRPPLFWRRVFSLPRRFFPVTVLLAIPLFRGWICWISIFRWGVAQRRLNSWSTSCPMTWDFSRKTVPGILFCWPSFNWRLSKICASGRRNPKIGEENAGYRKMKDIKKTATIPGQNVARERIVLRLCGEIPSRNVGEQRSRSASRARSRDPATRTPQPPPAPVRAPVTPPKTPPAPPTKIRYKAAPASINPAPTSTSNVTPPVKAPPVTPPAPPARSTRSPSNEPNLNPSRTVGAKKPPWRQRSQTPDSRTTRKRPYDIPQPPAPPPRMTGSQWLDQGHQGASSSSSGYRDYGYSCNQPSYYRMNPRTSSVEYVPGYIVPRQRWIQKYDGSWLDMIPQTPGQSIFFHQSGELRRRNEMNFYGYTFSMGLWVLPICICAAFAASLPVAFSSCLYSFDFVFELVSRQITSWALLVKDRSMLRHEENLCLFVIYFVLRVYTMLSCMLTCTLNSLCFMRHSRMAQDYSKPAHRKDCSCHFRDRRCLSRFQGSLSTGKATSPPIPFPLSHPELQDSSRLEKHFERLWRLCLVGVAASESFELVF